MTRLWKMLQWNLARGSYFTMKINNMNHSRALAHYLSHQHTTYYFTIDQINTSLLDDSVKHDKQSNTVKDKRPERCLTGLTTVFHFT